MSVNSMILCVCVCYFIGVIAVGMYASRRAKKASDYLVAGRQLGWVRTGITLSAVQIGVGIVLSGATRGYDHGVWPGIYYTIGCGGGLIIAGLVTSKKLRSQEGFVPMDFFSRRYGDSRGIRFWSFLSNIPSLLGIFIAQILACGGVLSGFGIPFHWGVVLTGAVVLLYCTVGGMWGVVIAAILAAAMSSANGVILSMGSCVARDFYNRFLHPEVSSLDELPKAKRISQATVLIGSIVGIIFSFYMTDILDAMIIFNYPYMGSLLIPMLGGLMWDRATRKGAFAAAAAGGIIGVGAFFIGIPSPIQGMINVDLALFIAYIVSTVVLVVVSLSDKEGQKVNDRMIAERRANGN